MPPPRSLTPDLFADALALPPAARNGAMTALYRAALGPVQLQRNLALFERFDRAGRAPLGWNLTASLVTLNWMVLHHLWAAALVYLALMEGLGLVVFGVARPLLNVPSAIECGLFTALGIFAIALPGLFGDALLHTEIRKRIARALAKAPTLPEACALLERQASSQSRLQKIAAINVLLLAAIGIALVLLPPSGWGQGDSSAAAGPTLSGKVEQAQVSPDPLAAPAPATLPGLLSPSSPPSPPQAGPDAAAVAAAPDAALPPPAPDTPVSAPTADPAPLPRPAQEPAAAPPAPLPAPLPLPAPAARAPEKVGVKAPAKAPEKAQAKATKKEADKASAKLRKKTAPTAPAPAEKAPVATASVPLDSDSPLPLVGSAAGHYLNVGVFSEVGNARRAQAKLLNAGLPAFRQTISGAKGELIRVRVGPYDSAAEAQKATRQVRRMGLEAVPFRQRAR